MCDSHWDLYENLERLQRAVKAIQERHEVEDERRAEASARPRAGGAL